MENQATESTAFRAKEYELAREIVDLRTMESLLASRGHDSTLKTAGGISCDDLRSSYEDLLDMAESHRKVARAFEAQAHAISSLLRIIDPLRADHG